MEIAIVGFIGVIVGAVINGLFTMFNNKLAMKNKKIINTAIDYVNDFSSLYRAEEKYCDTISKLSKELNELNPEKKLFDSPVTIKRNCREEVRNERGKTIKYNGNNASEFLEVLERLN